MATPQHHNECTIRRKMMITQYTWNLATDEKKIKNQEWQIRPCGTPLFSDQERTTGICKSCAGGWTHPNNFPCDINGNPIASPVQPTGHENE